MIGDVDSKLIFQLGGGRELLTPERTNELLAATVRKREEDEKERKEKIYYEQLSITDKSFNEASAIVLADFIQANDCFDNLRIIDISDCIAGQETDEDARVLQTISNVIGSKCRGVLSIDVSDNALGEEGVNVLCGLIDNQENLRAFYINNCGLSHEATKRVVEILSFRTPTKLEIFEFHNNMSGEPGANHLRELFPHMPLLKEYRFSGTRAGRAGSYAIASSLASSNIENLIRLDLADNLFGKEGAEQLAILLQKNQNLRQVILRDGLLEDEGIEIIMNALKKYNSKKITYLDIGANDITEDGALFVAKGIKKMTSLEELSLDENVELCNKGAKRISKNIPFLSNLKRLKINGCDIGGNGALAVVRACVNCPSFHAIEMNENRISEKAIEEIMLVLENASRPNAVGSLEDNEAEDDDDDDDSDDDDDDDDDDEDDNEEDESEDKLISKEICDDIPKGEELSNLENLVDNLKI